MPNPNPTEANEARRKYAAGTAHINVRIDANIWQAIEEELQHKTLADWQSKSEIVSYALTLVLEQAGEARLQQSE